MMKVLLRCAWLAFAAMLAVEMSGALTRDEELALIFRPFETDQVTLSPDGRHLAYTERDGDELQLVLRSLEANEVRRIPLAEARADELSGVREKTPARLTFMRWATADRLVFNVNSRNVWSVRADGTDVRELANATEFAPPPVYSGGGSAESEVLPPATVLDTLRRVEQPVNVVGLLRGERFVYVEALLQDRGSELSVTGGGQQGPVRLTRTQSLNGVPRGVLQIDVENGRSRDWGEAQPRATELMADRQGRPRISVVRPGRRSLTSLYTYTTARGGKWQPLDDVLKGAAQLEFRNTPENHLGQRSIPLGFDHDPDILFYASNVGRDTFGIYALDLKKQQRTEIAIETAAADLIDPLGANDDVLVFDDYKQALVGVRYVGAERATLWLDPELAEVQRNLKGALPNGTMEIIEWNQARTRFLVFGSSNTQPGAYYLYDRVSRRLDECLGRAPWLPDSIRNFGVSFGFQTREGVNLAGYVTLPRDSRTKRPPLVVLCHDGPWRRDQPGYNRWAQALAWMGFAVVQVNYRGSAGFGQKHLQAVRDGYDTVPLADILAATEWVLRTNKVDPRLVAIMGEGYGGYLALRAMQLHPDKFRCAVTFNAPTDLPVWINPASDRAEAQSLGLGSAEAPLQFAAAGSDDGNDDDSIGFGESSSSNGFSPSSSAAGEINDLRVLSTEEPPGPTFLGEMRRAFFGGELEKLRAISPLTEPELIKGPVMIVQAENNTIGRGRELSRELERLGRNPEFHSLREDEMADLPEARAALFRKVEGFLNVNIYDYAVKLGEAVEVK